MPPSSSQIQAETVDQAIARICYGVQPDPMPTTLHTQFDIIAKTRAPHEDDTMFLDRLTPEQRAIVDAFNKEAADGKLWLGICGRR